MSNRTYTIVLGIAVTALVGVLLASYFLHRLTLSPVAIFLLLFLIGIPAMSAIRFLPWAITMRMMPGLQDVIRDRRERNPVPAYAVWICAASFGASFALMIVGAMLMPTSAPSTAAEMLFMLWFGLFIFGWLGLIYTSRWVQTHGVAIAFAAIPTIGLSTAGLFGLVPDPDLSRFVFVAVGLGMYGLFMVLTPIFVGFSRAFGLID